MKNISLALVALALFCAYSQAQTSVSITQVTSTGGNAPWTVNGKGTCKLETGGTWIGASASLLAPDGMTVNTVFLNMPIPTPGGAAVNWTGTSQDLTKKGNYTFRIYIGYKDAAGMHQVASATQTVTVPAP